GMSVEQLEVRQPPATDARDTVRAPDSTVRIYSARPLAAGEVVQTPAWSLDGWIADLGVIDVTTGRVRRLLTKGRPRWCRLSPDGKTLAFSETIRFESSKSQQMLFDIRTADLDNGELKTLVSSVQLDFEGASVTWSPDGTRLAYLTGGPLSRGDCFVVSARGGEPLLVTPGVHPKFDIGPFRVPRWSANGNEIYLLDRTAIWKASADGSGTHELAKAPARVLEELIAGPFDQPFIGAGGNPFLIARTRDTVTKREGFYALSLDQGAWTRLLEENKSFGGLRRGVGVSSNGLLFFSQEADTPPDLWTMNVSSGSSRRLTDVNPHLQRYSFGSARLVEWRGSDGTTLRGSLLLPPDPKTPCPLIVRVYAGAEMSNSVNLFGLNQFNIDNLQLLATRGYAVFAPDIPTNMGTVLDDVFKAVMPGVEMLVEKGIADAQRLGVMGQSFGGYTTMALLVQTTRFKAAVVRAGFADLISAYGGMNENGAAYGIAIAEESQMRLGGTPWEYPMRYLQNSPFLSLDRIRTPVLIVHGDRDESVYPFLADQMFVGLRRLGRSVVYAKYRGEAHYEGLWAYPNQVDYLERMLAWFDEHLQPPPRDAAAPKPSSPKVEARP
ncbi:MAG: S9 family peptidase, partial [Bryobacteraceae bacterium]